MESRNTFSLNDVENKLHYGQYKNRWDIDGEFKDDVIRALECEYRFEKRIGNVIFRHCKMATKDVYNSNNVSLKLCRILADCVKDIDYEREVMDLEEDIRLFGLY